MAKKVANKIGHITETSQTNKANKENNIIIVKCELDGS